MGKDPKLSDVYISLSKLEYILGLKRFQLKEIADKSGSFYKPFDIHKEGTNKWRHIDNPQYPLKGLQIKLLKRLLEKRLTLLPNGMNGGIKGKSIVDNARIHIRKGCVGVIDIKDCFPNIDNLQVYDVWMRYFGCSHKIAALLTQLTTFQRRLPQGAPTSSLLCCFVLAPVFNQIQKYADKNSLGASIFVDDITISGEKMDVCNAIEPIIQILLANGYSVRKKKVKIISRGFSQKVTGITVNKGLSIGESEINQIRCLILETSKLKGHISSNDYSRIQGMINFTKQISTTQGIKLEKFAEQMLIEPIIQEVLKNEDERRLCKNFRIDHTYVPKGILSI